MLYALCSNIMELSDVLNKIKGQEGQEKEYFWALQVWDDGVKSAIWTIEDEKTKVISLGSYEVWQETVEDLVTAADKSLATASERFPQPEKEPSKVIFGLPYDWVEGEKIKQEKLQTLQTICEKLDLSAIGYVLTVDALVHHLKEVEGVPPSAILVSPQKEQVLVAVADRGDVEKVEQVKRSENLAEDVYEGLLRTKEIETLPSRMLLFNGGDMEDSRQVLIDFPWEQKLPFLHFPKVEILPVEFDISSICLAGGTEVAKSMGFKVSTEEVEIKPEVEVEKVPDFGFIKGKDIKEEVPEEQVSPEEKVEEVVSPPVELGTQETEKAEEIKEELPATGKKKTFLAPFFFIKEKISGFSLPSFSGVPFWGIFAGVMILLLATAGVLFLWYIPKAQVVVYVSPKPLEKDFSLTVDPNQEALDRQNLILPAKAIESESSGEKTAGTTGKKTVGDKAKGEVTIFNTGGTKNLATGTILTGPGGLKFTLDGDVSVGSGSAVDREEVKTTVSAADIGADYNLAADSQFSIANLDKSTIGAKNDSALTGGTSRQIQAVSEEDQKSLLDSLTEELEEKAKEELLATVPSGKKLIEESITAKETSRNFDNKVGDEAQTLTLSLKIKVSALTFSQDEFFSLAQEQIAGSIPEDYEAKKEEVNSNFEVEKQEKDGSILFRVLVSARLLPVIDTEEIAKNIRGKYPQLAQEYLATLPGYVNSEIDIRPLLPGKIRTLPRVAKNIQIEIRSQ